MKKTTKKLLSAFMILVMVILIIPVTGTQFKSYALSNAEFSKKVSELSTDLPITSKYADNDKSDIYFLTYSYAIINNNAVIICFKGGNSNEKVVVPSTINGYKVTYISNGAFSGHHELKEIVLPDTIKVICNKAFDYCKNLKTVNIPASVQKIGKNAFTNCFKLTNIKVSSDNKNFSIDSTGCLFNKAKTRLVAYPAGLKNDSYAIPSSVKTIGGYAFNSAKALKTVTIPKTVTSIEENAFEDAGLTSVSIPQAVKTIKTRTFRNCSIESVKIPESVTTIEESAFISSNIKSVTLPSSIKKIADYTFANCYALEKVVIPDSVTEIGNGAFESCSQLKKVTLPASLKSIGDNAFESCSIESIKIPNTVTNIGVYAFADCYELKSVVLPNKLKVIKERTFDRCWKLSSVSIPNSVRTIEEGAFSNCYALKEITIPASVTKFGKFIVDDGEYGIKIKCYDKSKALAHAKTHTNPYEIIEHTSHTDKSVLTKATVSANGANEVQCSVCGLVSKSTPIYKASNISIASSVVYTGKELMPAVTVKDSAGNKLKKDTDYTVTYSANNEVGTAKAKVTFKGNYSGTKSLTFKIVPAQATGLKASSITTTGFKLSWTKVNGAKYYKLEQSTDGKTWKTVTTTDKTTYTVSKLTAGSKMQYRVTALDGTKKIAGKASSVLKTGTKTVAPTVTLKSTKSKTATVSWKKVAGASKYVVYKSTDNKNWTKSTETTKLTCELTKLTAGKKIYVKVVAVNAYNQNSAGSKVVSVTVKK